MHTHHRKFLKCALGAKRINIGFFPSWQYRSSHPVKADIQLRWGWMLWYNRGWGFICMPSPDRSAPGSSRESAHGWGPSIEKPYSGWAEYSSLTRFLSSTALHGGFPSGGISSHWQRAWSFTPARSCETVGVAPEGAQLIASGLSTEVAETILQSRAPSIRKLYWSWDSGCGDRQLDPVNCLLVQCWSSRRPVSPQG